MTHARITRRLPFGVLNAHALSRAYCTRPEWYTSSAEAQLLAQRLVAAYGDKHEAAKAIWSTVEAINNWLAGRKRMTLANAKVVERAIQRTESELNAIRRQVNEAMAALAEWTVCHDSDAEPFNTSVAWARRALQDVCEAGKNLDNAAAELLYGREG